MSRKHHSRPGRGQRVIGPLADGVGAAPPRVQVYFKPSVKAVSGGISALILSRSITKRAVTFFVTARCMICLFIWKEPASFFRG